jgi:cellulose synthase/poly-beta-1,6-N-acetylglucosamine synthase-like glycosyltransferase
MERKRIFRPQILLVLLFLGFYFVLEYLLVSKIPFFRLPMQDYVMIGIISFLNLIPAGVFSFAMISLLPPRYSEINEDTLLARPPPPSRPRVAVLYATYNDFMQNYATYDWEQAQLGSYPFFILDDSTDESKRAEIDSFCLEKQCGIVRRKHRTGYKAGAMNLWIKRFGDSFDYFFVLDSDSQASFDSIRHCVRLANRDRKLAVVQSKTLTMTSSPSRLTRSAVCVQHAYIEIVQRAMRNMSTSPYYGHNALIKVEAVREVGGFVEESNEDYKTLALMHERGYQSIYAEQAVTWEEVPPDYMSGRKRSLRWSRDAVSQLGLLRINNPIAMSFYLFYGWVTHISNCAMLMLLPIAAAITLPYLFGNMSTELEGILAIGVIVFWPLLALRVNDRELTSGNMLKALLWGSVYNIPLMAPVGVQIIKTTVQKIWIGINASLGFRRELSLEFVVTPKTKYHVSGLVDVTKNLKSEISLGIFLTLVTLAAGHFWSIMFETPEILSSITIPLLVYSESKRIFARERTKSPETPIPVIASGYDQFQGRMATQLLLEQAGLSVGIREVCLKGPLCVL